VCRPATGGGLETEMGVREKRRRQVEKKSREGIRSGGGPPLSSLLKKDAWRPEEAEDASTQSSDGKQVFSLLDLRG